MITDYNDHSCIKNEDCDGTNNTFGSFVCTCEDGTELPEGQTNCNGIASSTILMHTATYVNY